MLPCGLCGSSRVQLSFALFCAVWRHLAIPTHLWCELGYARSRVTPTGVSRGVTGETSYASQVWVRTTTLAQQQPFTPTAHSPAPPHRSAQPSPPPPTCSAQQQSFTLAAHSPAAPHLQRTAQHQQLPHVHVHRQQAQQRAQRRERLRRRQRRRLEVWTGCGRGLEEVWRSGRPGVGGLQPQVGGVEGAT
eukprot:365397-Chlamydomonas_euryale.AAC.1